MKGYLVVTRKQPLLQIDAVDRKISVDDHVANQHPIAIEIAELKCRSVV
jgi:hypothetical protein